MTEDMEKKLNELLGMKKQLDHIMDERTKTDYASSLEAYEKELSFTRLRFWIGIVLGMATALVAAIGSVVCIHTTADGNIQGTLQGVLIILGVCGCAAIIQARVRWLTVNSKLTILREMKQFELRITELLKK